MCFEFRVSGSFRGLQWSLREVYRGLSGDFLMGFKAFSGFIGFSRVLWVFTGFTLWIL